MTTHQEALEAAREAVYQVAFTDQYTDPDGISREYCNDFADVAIRAYLTTLAPTNNGLVERLRGIYRVPITDGLGAVGAGEEPDNPKEFVRKFGTPPIQHEAAALITAQAAEIERLKTILDKAVEALEPFAGVADLVDIETEGFSGTDIFELMFNDMLFDRFTLAHFRAALLVLTAIQEARHAGN